MLGIEKFINYFQGHENEYVIIGGTACELLMNAEELPFRATKDIDMVLIVESLTIEFGKLFWNFIYEAGYQSINKSTGNSQFYRFSHPKSTEFPFIIELFSKKLEWIAFDNEKIRLAPIHIDDEISSLSAILLNDAYYTFLKEGSQTVNGVSVLSAEYIIPFKAKAWLDLTQRKNNGEHVDSKNIKKHKNDIFRLSILLIPTNQLILSDEIREDMKNFLEAMKHEEINLKQLGYFNQDKQSILELLSNFYAIKETVS